jgi:hypothetical protein
MFLHKRDTLAARFKPDGPLTYVNDVCKQYLPGRVGDTILIGINDKSYRKQIANRIHLFTPDKPVRTYIDKLHGITIRWYNKAIFDKDGNIKEFEGIGRLFEGG